MDVDPLDKVKSANFDNKISNDLYNLIVQRFSIVKEGIKRIENITNIKFPYFYIEPNLIVSYSRSEFQNMVYCTPGLFQLLILKENWIL